MKKQNKMHLSTITDVFEISGRGCVVVPGIPRTHTGPEKIWRGCPILLKFPDGGVRATHVKEIEFCLHAGRKAEDIAFLLPEDLSKADIPVGTEIWVENKKS